MANITLLPSAKVPLVYDGENTMTTEWYRFFWNIYGFTGTGVVPVNKGGTGLDTIGNHQLIIGNANNVFEPASLSSASIAITYPAGFINLELGTSGVTPGTYGSASQVGVFTVNQYGVLTAASNTSIGIDASQIISGTLPVIRGGTGQSTYTDGQLLIGNSTGNTLTKATLTAGTGISVTNGAGSITIANTGVLSVSGTAPVVSSGGATPAISMAAANTTTNGYLTSTDWNTFNNKAPATSGTSILYGNGSGGFSNVTIGTGISFAGGTLSATGSGGTVTSVSGTAPISVATGTTTPVISISQATTSTDGYLSSTDWNTFNNKQPAGSYLTAVSVVSTNGFAGTSSGGTTPALTLSTTITGLLKGNGTAISAATSGTDYAPATSGTSILYGNGAGGFSNVTIGTGVSFAGGTLSATGSGGTVTSVAALTLGTTGTDLSSTVANGTTTPVITLNVPTASAANRGALSAADWTTFNSKVSSQWVTSGSNIYYSAGSAGVGISSLSAWGANWKALQLPGGTSIVGRSDANQTNIFSNAYYDGSNFKYFNTDFATRETANGGTFGWYTAPSGTSGNTITFTQRMALNSTGQLFLGATASRTFPGGTTPIVLTEATDISVNRVVGNVVNYAGVQGPIFALGKTRGAAVGSNTVVASGDFLGLLAFYGADGTALIEGARIAALVDGTPGTNDMPTRLTFSTTADGASSVTERMRIPSTGGVQMVTTVSVGNATPSTSGAGITFPATQSASTDVNTLDDYEEGTWTPTIAGSTTAGTATYASVIGKYTKIGNCVFFEAYINYNSGTGTGNLLVSGLPFTSSSTGFYIPSIFVSAIALTASNLAQARIATSSSSVGIFQYPVGGGNTTEVPYDVAGVIGLSGYYNI